MNAIKELAARWQRCSAQVRTRSRSMRRRRGSTSSSSMKPTAAGTRACSIAMGSPRARAAQQGRARGGLARGIGRPERAHAPGRADRMPDCRHTRRVRERAADQGRGPAGRDRRNEAIDAARAVAGSRLFPAAAAVRGLSRRRRAAEGQGGARPVLRRLPRLEVRRRLRADGVRSLGEGTGRDDSLRARSGPSCTDAVRARDVAKQAGCDERFASGPTSAPPTSATNRVVREYGERFWLNDPSERTLLSAAWRGCNIF